MGGQKGLTMNIFIVFLLGSAVVVAVISALYNTRKVNAGLLTNVHAKVRQHGKHFPKLIGMVILVAHASEVGQIVVHASPIHYVVATMLFVLWIGTEQRLKEEEI
jgi:hypothetical protein